MAFLKKQLNKANQFLHFGGGEQTNLGEDYATMERKAEVTSELVEEVQLKTKDYLQLNAPFLGGKPVQPAFVLGDCMRVYGKKLEDDYQSNGLGQALQVAGESMRKLGEVKSTLDEGIKENFLKPLNSIQHQELKNVEYHREKVMSRRFEFDSKKIKQQKSGKNGTSSGTSEAEVKGAAQKFAESYHNSQISMNMLEEKYLTTVDHLSYLVESLQNYHHQCAEILRNLSQALEEKKTEIAMEVAELHQFSPKTLKELDMYLDDTSAPSSLKSPRSPGVEIRGGEHITSQFRPPSFPIPSCKALYDFNPELPTELGFKNGDVIQLLSRVGQDWFEGTLNGKRGLFPVSFVYVVVPLP